MKNKMWVVLVVLLVPVIAAQTLVPAPGPTLGALDVGLAVDYRPDGDHLAVGHGLTPFLSVFYTNNWTAVALTPNAANGQVNDVAYSNGGAFLATASAFGMENLTIYSVSGDTYTEIIGAVDVQPNGSSASVAWHPDDTFLAVTHSAAPFVTIYSRVGAVFTKVADPADPPSFAGGGVSWHPGGQHLAVGHGTNATFEGGTLSIYDALNSFALLRRVDDLPSSLDPAFADLPPDTTALRALSVEYSPDGNLLLTTGFNEFDLSANSTPPPPIRVYRVLSGDIVLVNAVRSPPALGAVVFTINGGSWHPNGTAATVGTGQYPFIHGYDRYGETFVKLATPAGLPTGAVLDTAWHPDGQSLAAAFDGAVGVAIYNATGLSGFITIPGGLVSDPTGNPIQILKDAVRTLLGSTEAVAGWVLGLSLVGIMVAAFHQRGWHPLATAVGAVFAVIIALFLGFIPLYAVLAVVLFVTAAVLYQQRAGVVE